MKEYKIEVLYTKNERDEIPLIDVFYAQIEKDNFISFNNYRFLDFIRLKNEETTDFLKRTFKSLLSKEKYKFIKDIRITRLD